MIALIRVTGETRLAKGKADPSKTYGFQTCGLQKAPGMFEMFTRMFSPDRKEAALVEGDYELHAENAYIDRKGNLQVGTKFLPVKK
jgi:hypothetical protein